MACNNRCMAAESSSAERTFRRNSPKTLSSFSGECTSIMANNLSSQNRCSMRHIIRSYYGLKTAKSRTLLPYRCCTYNNNSYELLSRPILQTMKFRMLQENLRKTLWERIDGGELTGLRLEGMDRVLNVQHLSVLDLIDPAEVNKRAWILQPSEDEFDNVVVTDSH